MEDLVDFRLETIESEKQIEDAFASKSDSYTVGETQSGRVTSQDPLNEAMFVGPVTIIITATIAIIAKRLVDHWLKNKEQGVLIDTREKPPLISRIAGIPTGFLVIIDKEGNATPHKGDFDKSEDLAPILSDAFAS